MNHYLVTFIHGSTRIVRNVIAHSSMQATRIGLGMMPDTRKPCAIICKPLRGAQ